MDHNSCIVSFALLVAACGGSQPPPQVAESEPEPEQQAEDLSQVEMTAEVGALPVKQTEYAFKEAFGGIQDCFAKGAQRLDLIGGDFAVKVIVNKQGQVDHVFAERSTLGHDETERCMFDALRGAPWPGAKGGPYGIAQSSFSFDMTGDVRPPVMWDSFEIQSVLDEHSAALSECKADARGVIATLYVDTEGKALSVGVSGEDEAVESARDCLIEVFTSATYPSPGSWPAKVSVRL